MDVRNCGPHRELRGLRHHGQRQAVGPLPACGSLFAPRKPEQRVPRPDARPAERVQPVDDFRPHPGRPGGTGYRSVDLPRGPIAGR